MTKCLLKTITYPVLLAYVLQVKVEMEMEIQQSEKAKAMREEQLDRLTQICQEQAVRHLIFLTCLTLQQKRGPQSHCTRCDLRL